MQSRGILFSRSQNLFLWHSAFHDFPRLLFLLKPVTDPKKFLRDLIEEYLELTHTDSYFLFCFSALVVWMLPSVYRGVSVLYIFYIFRDSDFELLAFTLFPKLLWSLRYECAYWYIALMKGYCTDSYPMYGNVWINFSMSLWAHVLLADSMKDK